MGICPFLENDPRIWEWLAEPERVRIRRLLETVDVETLKTYSAFNAFLIEPLGSILFDRFNGFDDTTKISIISEYPKKELVPSGINIYAEAGSFRTAEYLGQSIILPLAPFFQEEDIESILSAASENGQICYASGLIETNRSQHQTSYHIEMSGISVNNGRLERDQSVGIYPLVVPLKYSNNSSTRLDTFYRRAAHIGRSL